MATIDISTIDDLILGASGDTVIAVRLKDGSQTRIAMPRAEVQRLAPALLCAASAAGSSSPAQDMSVGPCHLPVMQWECGLSNMNGEPVLVLTIPGGARVMFQFPPQTAQACGQALISKGLEAMPQGRPN